MSRPKGSKNLTPEEREARAAEKASLPKRGRGRPKVEGSKRQLKKKQAERDMIKSLAIRKEDRKIGRPKGSKGGYTMSQVALAARQAKHMVRDPKTDEDISYNARLIEHIMQIHEIGTHADRNDLLSLRSCFLAYIKLCQENGFNVTNLSAYAAMGFDHMSFCKFLKKDDPEIKAFGAFVKETCAMFRESLISTNKINPVIGIFWQRNFDGLRNDTEAVQSAVEQDEDFENTNKSYKEKYKNLISG